MDEPSAWAEPWPFWKFGLKQNDLNTTLHDKYNTISMPVQDPQAFHHDVYELSTKASNLGELEQLLEERKMLRLNELNTMLEDASFEIIGNPRLIASDQWALAIQLFRTRSFDSLVRYFASYLPSDHDSGHDSDSGIHGSDSDATSPISSIGYDGPILFDEPEEDDAIYTREPSETFSTCDTAVDNPSRSNTISSEDSGVSVNDQFKRLHRPRPRPCPSSKTMSRPEPGSGHVPACLQSTVSTLHDAEDSSPSEDPETPCTSASDLSEKDEPRTTIVDEDELDGHLSISHAHLQTKDTMDSDTPTPKADPARSPAAPATSFFDTGLSPLRTRSPSSNRSHPHHAHHSHHTNQTCRNHRVAVRQLRRREGSLDCVGGGGECPPGGRAGRHREASPDRIRSRARARRRHAGA